ncbi:MAG TPA: aerial mycelium formation protein [Actinomycetospora sp.]|uniref:RsiG family protein n=1 Tax=Actinomycetospora sp. TaxID=1872135 RepID=UPI002F418F50
MIEFRQGGRRRIDRVLDPGFLAAIRDRSLDELRAMRDDAAQEETDLSYLRRLLHARMDIVRFEEHRRADGGDDAEGSVMDALPRILADNALGPAAGRGRHQTVEPSRAESHRRHVEALLADTGLSDVSGLSNAELTECTEAYAAEEASVSDHRIRVQQVMDACNDEIARRYREGSASVDELLRREREGA